MSAPRRRSVLKTALGILAVAATATSLAACSSSGSSNGGSAGSSTGASGATPAATGGGGGGGTSGGATSGTIKIGILAPTSGNAAAYGKEMVNGWNLYWDQHNDQVAGKKIETLHVDGGGSVSTVLSGVTKLVQNDKVSAVASVMFANISLALVGPLTKDKVPYVESVAGAMAMTGKNNSPYFVRLGGPSSSQTTQPFGAWAATQGYKKVVTLCSDFNFGYEACGGFVNTFTDGGGTITKQLWAPIGTTDFSSYIAQIKAAKPDAVFAEFTGADNARFLKAWSSFGMKGSIPLLAGEATTDQTVLNGITAQQGEGIVSSGVWANGLDTPEATAFRKAYEDKYKSDPSFYGLSMYIAAEGIAKAITELNGDVSDSAAFMQKLRSLTDLPTPIGPISIDKYGSQTQNVFIRKVVEKDGKLVNEVTKTYPNVTQFWNYPVDQFFAHPTYSKTYQGAGVWPNPES